MTSHLKVFFLKADIVGLLSSLRTLLSEQINSLKVVQLALNAGDSFQQIQCFYGTSAVELVLPLGASLRLFLVIYLLFSYFNFDKEIRILVQNTAL